MRRKSSPISYIKLIPRFITLGVFIFILWSLLLNLIDLSKLDQRLHDTEKEIRILDKKNEQLQVKASQVEQGVFDEAVIRNKLGLVKPDETVVIIPEQLHKYLDDELSAASASPTSLVTQVIWMQWLNLFF